ncbi:MAG: alanine--tRNA ligase, partial [Planctomycetota bacterium]
MPGSKDIRSSFIDFFREKGHRFVPSSPVIPLDDPTLLFSNAGMNQFKDVFLGSGTRPYARAVNSQKCIRAGGKHNDLEDVGTDTYHHTFFEMLGNWSFGDYFKAEAIEWAWELLTKVWGIEHGRLYATIFSGDKNENLEFDTQAQQLWRKATPLPAERVLAFGKKDNFWEMGETGPCGPCSEIHIDLGAERCDKKDDPDHKCRINGGCGRFIELWNLVFIQYNRDESGRITPLPARHIDTGAGLERLACVLQGKNSNYDTDIFTPIIKAISDITHKKYTATLESHKDAAFRVIADHLRAVTSAVADGGIPSNEGRGYVIRRILRRAARFGRELDMHEPFIHKLVPVLAEIMGEAFSEINDRAEYVATVIESEEAGFGRTLDRGIEIFSAAADRAEKSDEKIISGEDAFQLYDTYGFPLDLTQLMARERKLFVDTEKFDELMGQQRQRARSAQKAVSTNFVYANQKLPCSDDSQKYLTDTCSAKVIGWLDSESFNTKGSFGLDQTVRPDEGIGKEDIGLVLDKTCFYAEAGGQAGDKGIIRSDDAHFAVERTEKFGECVIHWGKVISGRIHVDNEVEAAVDKSRESSQKNHTATHLLQWALQEVLGKNVQQQGSFVCPDYLRFDFTWLKSMTSRQIRQTEHLVQEKINAALPVTWCVLPIDEAKKVGAMALFTEKYGDEVRVVAIGEEKRENIEKAFSREFCGGTHVDNTAQIAGFKIIKEESISAGVRRITALTGSVLTQYLEQRSEIIDDLCELLKVPAEQITERVAKLIEENKRLAKDLKSADKKGTWDIMAEARKLLDSAERFDNSLIITGQLPPVNQTQARGAIDMLKKKAKSAAIVLAMAENEKATILAGVTNDLIEKGLDAGDIIKQISPIIDGGGGGRAQMAAAGGKNPEKI